MGDDILDKPYFFSILSCFLPLPFWVSAWEKGGAQENVFPRTRQV